jgi:oxalate decarboxylase/phosphoglucose isomerase-like protein (cupin superfamily)
MEKRLKKSDLSHFHRGWFVGNFDRAIHQDNFEVGVQVYASGTVHDRHFHEHTREINVVLDGSCSFHVFNQSGEFLDNLKFKKDDVIVVEPFEVVQFVADEDCRVLVVKNKSNPKDKVIV